MTVIQETTWYEPNEKLPEELKTEDIFEKGYSDYVLIQMGTGRNYNIGRYFYPLEKWVIPGYTGDWKPLLWTKINHPIVK
jgi:hypothetical protein